MTIIDKSPSIHSNYAYRSRQAHNEETQYQDAIGTTDSSAAINGSSTVFSPKLSGELWSMQSEMPDEEPNALAAKDRKKELEDELHRWAEINVAEKIHAQYLASKGITEEQLAAMPAEDRKAIEDEIGKVVREQMKAQEQTLGSGSSGLLLQQGEQAQPQLGEGGLSETLGRDNDQTSVTDFTAT
ncbi:hypothetical protein [Neorhizobium sp. DAR64872/K0K18]|uniref:hypothetical protein n=1 Tax=Neorhizobium sp. DAR64872/K0K18 TaxID=3421958 RepID=UPI003D26A465